MADPASAPTGQALAEIVEQATAAMRALDLNGANAIARAALDAGAEHPFLLKVHALWLNENGRHRDALRTFHHAREMSPDDPMILNGIAGVLSAMGEYDAALKMADASLAIAPQIATTHYLRGWALEAKADTAAARSAYERTLSLQPKYVQALAGLASTAARQQDFAIARTSAEKALALAPKQPTATLALATADIAEKSPAIAETRLRELLKTSMPEKARALAWGMLGDALDAQDRTGEAFEAYLSEKAAYRTLTPESQTAPSVSANLLRLEADLAQTPAPQWKVPPAGNADSGVKTHVFIVGFPRSGTTLLEQVLAAHPDVTTLEEVDLLRDAAERCLADTPAISSLLTASASEMDGMREIYWQGVRDRGGDMTDKVFIDKHPLNTVKLPLIARLFPNARVIFAVRDPRDVVFSSFRRHFKAPDIAAEFSTLERTALAYDAVMKVGAWSRENLPVPFHLHHHEKMIADFDSQTAALCDFLGIVWTEKMRDFAQTAAAREIASQSASQVRHGLSQEGVDRWRSYRTELAPVMPILAPWIEQFGYPRE